MHSPRTLEVLTRSASLRSQYRSIQRFSCIQQQEAQKSNDPAFTHQVVELGFLILSRGFQSTSVSNRLPLSKPSHPPKTPRPTHQIRHVTAKICKTLQKIESSLIEEHLLQNDLRRDRTCNLLIRSQAPCHWASRPVSCCC